MIKMNKLSKFDIKNKKIRKIASEINKGKSSKKKIEGVKYMFSAEKGKIIVKTRKTNKILNSEMMYDASEGNQFNITLFLAKMVKIAM